MSNRRNTSSACRPLVVLKFGGSVLLSEDHIGVAGTEIRRWIDRGHRVLAVVSALEGATDGLIAQARRYARAGEGPDAAAQAQLVATGEITSASLLGLELARAGVRSAVCPPWAIGLRAAGQPLDAFPESLSAGRIFELLRSHDALVIPGFIGLDQANNLVLLGRGGSDLSAIFVAHAVGADRCRLVKDVDGLYERDPADPGIAAGTLAPPRRFATLSWADALDLDGGIVQHKAVRFALDRRWGFEVGTIARDDASIVGDHAVSFAVGAAAAGLTAREPELVAG